MGGQGVPSFVDGRDARWGDELGRVVCEVPGWVGRGERVGKGDEEVCEGERRGAGVGLSVDEDILVCLYFLLSEVWVERE